MQFCTFKSTSHSRFVGDDGCAIRGSVNSTNLPDAEVLATAPGVFMTGWVANRVDGLVTIWDVDADFVPDGKNLHFSLKVVAAIVLMDIIAKQISKSKIIGNLN